MKHNATLSIVVGLILIFLIIGGDLFAVVLSSRPPTKLADCTNNVPAKIQCGQVSVSISGGTTTGIAAVTFDTVFLQKPNVTLTPLGTTPSGVFASGFSFQAPGNAFQVWTSMPAAETYIYSPGAIASDCCTIVVPGAGISGLSCSFTVDVHVASTSGTSKLIVRYSPDGSTWTDVGSTSISITGIQSSVISFPTLTNSVLYLSVWGQNGNGVGDNPSFYSISLGCTLTSMAWGFLTYGITTAGFNVEVLDNAPAAFTNSIAFNWIAVNG